MFVRFVDTFTVDDHPGVLAVSGGEAFLRPKLLRDLADRAAEVGTKTAALSGMFWAKDRRIPPPIKRAIDALDHFSCSLDVFHEREVKRADVYRALDTLLSEGKDVSMHLVGLDADDPYLVERTAEIRDLFDGRVPMLVNAVNSYGRAAEWLDAADATAPPSVQPNPCTLAAWPLVAFDGTVVACGNDDVVDGPAPAHLRLGHANVDGWPAIKARMLTSSLLRAIRTFGPEHIAHRLDFTVRGRIEILRRLVQSFADDRAVLHHHRAIGSRARLIERLRRQFDRPTHEFFVVHLVPECCSSRQESVPFSSRQRKREGAMRPFEGIRVIDVTHVLAGPFAAYQLAVLGADVIKVDDPNDPDQSRSSGTDKELNDAQMGTGFLTQASNKRAITLDLKTERDREILKKLVATADVFVENYRPGAFEKLGLG